MSFMMTWKSPPKALHSFSIPASIFPLARKNPQLPKTFTSFKKASRQVSPNDPAEESIEDFIPSGGTTARGKSGFKTNVHWKSGEILSTRAHKALVSQGYQLPSVINTQKHTAWWRNQAADCQQEPGSAHGSPGRLKSKWTRGRSR